MGRGTTLTHQSTVPQWLADNSLLKTQTSAYTRKYQPAHLLSLCGTAPPPPRAGHSNMCTCMVLGSPATCFELLQSDPPVLSVFAAGPGNRTGLDSAYTPRSDALGQEGGGGGHSSPHRCRNCGGKVCVKPTNTFRHQPTAAILSCTMGGGGSRTVSKLWQSSKKTAAVVTA